MSNLDEMSTLKYLINSNGINDIFTRDLTNSGYSSDWSEFTMSANSLGSGAIINLGRPDHTDANI